MSLVATPALAADRANSPAAWDGRRTAVHPDPCPTTAWRYTQLTGVLDWVFQQQHPSQPRAVLDIAAGVGLVGVYARTVWPEIHYHATEQSPIQRTEIQGRVPGASVALWSFGGDGLAGGVSLERALAESDDPFLRAYPVVVLSHVLEHVADYYGLLREAWAMVAPDGVLVVCVPREDEHETHCHRFDWDRLLGVLRQFGVPGVPVATWPSGSFGDLLAAVAKPCVPAGDGEGAEEHGPALVGRR